MEKITLPITKFGVEFKPFYTQRAEEAYNKELTDGLTFKESITGSIVSEGIKPDALDRANKAALKHVVASVWSADGGSQVKFDDDWILDLPRTDYLLLVEQLAKMQGKDTAAKEEGKKNGGKIGAQSSGGERPSAK